MFKLRPHQKHEGIIYKAGMEPYQMWYRWVMLALIWLSYFSFGIIMRSMAPLVTPILRDLNISYSQMGIIFGSWPLTYIIVAIIAGAIIDRWGIRKSLFVGVFIIGLSAVLRYFANGFNIMFLCVALFGLGGPMISIGAPKTISVWFREKDKATAVGIYSTGASIGGLLSLSLTNSVVMPLTMYSWKLTFVVYGLVAFTAALAWWFLARDVKPAEARERTSIVEVFRGLISVRNVQLILLVGFLSMAISHGFTNWLPKILETGGYSQEVAGFAASIPVLASIPGALTIPRLTPPRLRGRVVSLSFLVGAMVLLLIATTSGGPLITGLVLYGIVFRCATPLLMLVLMDLPEVGSKYMGSAGGMYFCVAETGGFLGPLIIGVIRDVTGSFLAGTSVLAGVSIFICVMAFLIKTKSASDTKAQS